MPHQLHQLTTMSNVIAIKQKNRVLPCPGEDVVRGELEDDRNGEEDGGCMIWRRTAATGTGTGSARAGWTGTGTGTSSRDEDGRALREDLLGRRPR
jgi:hypothetical protein